MRYRALGTTGLTVSEIGFGCWGIGGMTNGATSYGWTDDVESLRALRAAFDLGVTLFDTADVYGYGHSEELIGTALRDVRRQVVIASKVGWIDYDRPPEFSASHLREAIEGTLRRLQTDYLDLYQLHNPPVASMDAQDETFSTLEALIGEGKIRAFGISVCSPEEGLTAAQRFGAKAIQANFSLIDQRVVDNGLLGWCAEHGVGVIARTPLCYGFLTGRIAPEAQFDPSDHRSLRSVEQRALWADAPKLFMDAMADPPGQTPAQMALRYCLSYPAVATAIPGMLRSEEVRENVTASDLGSLSPEQRLTVERIYRKHTFFLQPAARA